MSGVSGATGHRRAPVPLLALLALLVAGCGGGAPEGSATPASTGPPSAAATASFQPTAADFRAVRRVLARRAAAVRAHDESAFLATVDHGDEALLAGQRTLFANLSGLSIASLSYAMDPTAVLVPGEVAGHDPVLRPQITEFLQIAGAMDRPVTNSVDETFVRRNGHWLLGDEVLQGGTAAYEKPQWRPWAGSPIASRRVGSMTVLVDRARASTLDEVVSAVQSDIAFDADLLRLPASSKIIVDATSNGAASSFSSTSKEEAAAVTFALGEGTLDDDSAFRARAGLAIKINPHTVGRVVSDQGIMRHELAHYLLHDFGGTSPKWLTEGVATWIQYFPDDFRRWRVPSSLYDRLMHADHTLPILGLFDDDPALNYPISQAVVSWLVQHYGVARLLELMRTYRRDYVGADVDAVTPRALREVYGVTPGQVTTGAWALLAEFAH
jgi:hypothetical protein